MQIERMVIHGTLVGPIWQGRECYKDLTYSMKTRAVDKSTLREHVLRATDDGDFQFCRIADGYLEITTWKPDRTGIRRRTRFWPLSGFPSIQDLVTDEWSGPIDGYDED